MSRPMDYMLKAVSEIIKQIEKHVSNDAEKLMAGLLLIRAGADMAMEALDSLLIKADEIIKQMKRMKGETK